MNKFFAAISTLLLSATGFTATAAEPSGYYDSCEGFSGKELLTKLSSVISKHTSVGYDGLWTVYNDSDVDENGLIWDMYSTKRWTPGKERCGNYSRVGDCINREHSFPKSWFNNKSPMNADAFHVYPTDGKVNGQRSNYPYGECSGGTTLASNGGVQALGKLGTSTFPGYSGKVFEPADQYKGDFARSYLYMATAYNSNISSWNSDMLAGNNYPAFKSWAIDLLLKWHRQDPVSQKEIDRNDAVYKHQKNRNPYIDHPELVEYVWGNRTSEKWYASGAPEPALAQPVDGSTVDFGLIPANYTISRGITLQGANLTSPVSVSLSPATDFTCPVKSVSAATVNAGTTLTVTANCASAGKKTATLTLTCGSLKSVVTISAEATSGIPALEAINITDDSFTARWISLGDYNKYTLDVKLNGTSITGYPREVLADAEEAVVEGLNPSSTYTYTISSPDMASNTVSVTTADLVPEIQYLGSNVVELDAMPGEPSEAKEVWLYTENLSEGILVEVQAPFQVSTDMTTWSTTARMTLDDERFYIRISASDAGVYESDITLTSGSLVEDDGVVKATVRDTSVVWFVEDFELAGEATHKIDDYDCSYYNGSQMEWTINDAGIWKSDSDKNGDYSLRLGKSAASSIESKRAKDSGIGTVSFNACRRSSSDGDVMFSVEHSLDGKTWDEAGSVVVNSDALSPYSVKVNAPGNRFIRLRQTAGKRGNLDDIAVSDYKGSGIDLVDDDPLAGWTAYGTPDTLTVVVTDGVARTFRVFDMEGATMAETTITDTAIIPLPAGLYIVTDMIDARRVVVR